MVLTKLRENTAVSFVSLKNEIVKISLKIKLNFEFSVW